MAAVERDPNRLFAPAAVDVERRADGTLYLRSPLPLESGARCVGEYLELWAQAAPDRRFVLERNAHGDWQGLTYGEALDRVRRVAAGLLQRGFNASRPVAILSDNSVDAAVLSLAAMHIGVPVAFVSPAYSLLSRDHVKLRTILSALRPGLVFVSDAQKFAPALAASADIREGVLAVGGDDRSGAGDVTLDALAATRDDEAVQHAHASVTPDTVAKLLFTSGSTGEPKGVINTQRMLCANQQAKSQIWPFVAITPPVIVDWLLWSHTFGGNHNFNLVLRSGGTLYIDAGRPAPGLFERTIANLRDVAPTVYFNVPRGYDMLVSALRGDPKLRESFFSRLQVIFYAAAALPQHLWDALDELARETVGASIPLVSAWGSTETAPLATSCHFQAERTGVIGLPIPGCELKLVPAGEKLEVRVKGPHVTPGYWGRPDLTARNFDAEGYYCIGDAVRFVDASRPERGLLFDGRVSEDFKLDSGTWVNAGMLRVQAVAALAPIAQDAVLTGHDRNEVGLLVFPNVAECRALCPELPTNTPLPVLLAQPAVRNHVAGGLARLKRAGAGSSMFAARALLLEEPASIDGGEITDKGYINQAAVLTRRSSLVDRLHATPDDVAVIRPAD